MRNRVLPILAVLLQLAVLAGAASAEDPPTSLPPWAGSEATAPETPGMAEHGTPGAVEHGKEAENKEHPEEEHHIEWEEEACHHEVFWLRGEYLLWWTKNGNVPALLTTGGSTDTLPGALGQTETKVLYGGDGAVSFKNRSGARFTLGWSPNPDSIWSVEGNYFFLDARKSGNSVVSPGNPVVARPFFDVVNGIQNSSLDAYPGVVKGGVAINTSSFLQGGEVNVQALLRLQPRFRLQALAGFRYLDLTERLDINENTTILDPNTAANFGAGTILVTDHFGVNNNFYGGQFGLRTEARFKRLIVGAVGKIAFGETRESVNIAGQTTISTTPATITPGGLLALSSNSGVFRRNAFAVVPEVGVTAGVKITERIIASIGYNYLFWSRVVRPGDQIDTSVNVNNVPTSTTFGAGGVHRPTFTFQETTYWAQGLTFGLEFRY